VNRLNQASEVDAFLAAGISLSRLARPLLALGIVLAVITLIVFGFLQPYSRYAYRAVLHSAQNAGWSGAVPEGTVLSPGDNLTMTTDEADAAGQRLTRVFIRRITPAGREEVTTAGMAEMRRTADGKNVQLILKDGQQLRFNRNGDPELLSFKDFTMELPLSGPEKLLRARGGDERELNNFELLAQERNPASVIPHATLAAELYSRLARGLSLPVLPLLAVPLGLSAKRSGRAPGIIVGFVLLLAFHQLISLGESLAGAGRVSAEVGVALPFGVFVAICFTVFLTSRKRPGETPVGRAMEALSRLAARFRPRNAAAEEQPS
jgi:lipopolysaccharide export system permease protein